MLGVDSSIAQQSRDPHVTTKINAHHPLLPTKNLGSATLLSGLLPHMVRGVDPPRATAKSLQLNAEISKRRQSMAAELYFLCSTTLDTLSQRKI